VGDILLTYLPPLPYLLLVLFLLLLPLFFSFCSLSLKAANDVFKKYWEESCSGFLQCNRYLVEQ
jgi:hypothetical protein